MTDKKVTRKQEMADIDFLKDLAARLPDETDARRLQDVIITMGAFASTIVPLVKSYAKLTIGDAK
jgi:hypothetical protein